MTRRHLMVAGAYALASFGLTVATFWPGSLEATDEKPGLAPTIQKAILKVNGCELSLTPDTANPAAPVAFKDGDCPAFKLVAVNTTDAEARVDWNASLSSMPPISPLSRRMPTPTILWKKADLLVLAPHETRTVTLATDTKLPKGSIIVTLASDKQAVVAMRFATSVETSPLALIGTTPPSIKQ